MSMEKFEARLAAIRQLDGRLCGFDPPFGKEFEEYMQERTVDEEVDIWDVRAEPYESQEGVIIPNTLFISIMPDDAGELVRRLISGEEPDVIVQDLFHKILAAFGDGSWSHSWECEDGELICVSSHDPEVITRSGGYGEMLTEEPDE